MKEKVFWWSIAGFFFVCIAGTVNHFLYELSGNNIFVGIFVPINESVWEHLKLLFFPFVFLCTAEFIIYGRYIRNFLFSRLLGVLSGLLIIPTIFYIYSGIIGKSIVVVDILLFFVSVFVSYFVSYIMLDKVQRYKPYLNIIAVILFLVLIILFAVFTLLQVYG